MKTKILFIALLCLALASAMAESLPALSIGEMTLRIDEVRQDAESVRLTLSCKNEGVTDREITLVAPTVNGSPACFDSGWGSAVLSLKAGEARRETVVLVPDRKENAIESISLRFVCAGTISSPLSLERHDGGWQAIAASSGGDGSEPPLVRAGTATAAPRECSVALHDQISPAQAAILDQAHAWICLKAKDGQQEAYLPFCRLSLTADESGGISGTYSGMAATCSASPLFPLYMEEGMADGDYSWAIGGIVLSGDAVFYADLSFVAACDAQDGIIIESSAVESPELGGVCENCPLPLFLEASVHHAAYGFTDKYGNVRAHECDGTTAVFDLAEPLTIDLRPASDLGEIYVYFEYWFTDGSAVLRAPVGLRDVSQSLSCPGSAICEIRGDHHVTASL